MTMAGASMNATIVRAPRLCEPLRVAETLRFHRYRMIGDPYFFHGRYVVRTHDRFGRTSGSGRSLQRRLHPRVRL